MKPFGVVALAAFALLTLGGKKKAAAAESSRKACFAAVAAEVARDPATYLDPLLTNEAFQAFLKGSKLSAAFFKACLGDSRHRPSSPGCLPELGAVLDEAALNGFTPNIAALLRAHGREDLAACVEAEDALLSNEGVA